MAATGTATKTAPKTAPGAPAPAADTKPETKPEPVDPGPLSFSDVPTGELFGRASTGSQSQFTQVLQDSYKNRNEAPGFGVKEFTVPTAARDTQIQAVRSEAQRLNLGVTIRHKPVTDASGADTDRTVIRFQAGEKRKRSTK